MKNTSEIVFRQLEKVTDVKNVIHDAMIGTSIASIGVLIAKFNGFNWISLTAILYLAVFGVVLAGFKSRIGLSGSFLHRIVLVAEGEELKMKKLLSGEKYRIKGDLEKL